MIEKRDKWFDVSNRCMGSILAFSQLWEMAELKPIIRAYFQEYYEEEKEKYKKKEGHHLFVALVFDLLENGRYEEAMFQFLPAGSVYQTFLENWNTTDEALYQKLIFDICDAHIYSCLDVKNKMTEISYEQDFDSYYVGNKVGANSNVTAGIKFLLLAKKLQCSLDANNIFGSDRMLLSNTTQNVFQTFKQYYDTQYVRFSLSYSFGNKNISVKQQNTSNEEEKGRVY